MLRGRTKPTSYAWCMGLGMGATRGYYVDLISQLSIQAGLTREPVPHNLKQGPGPFGFDRLLVVVGGSDEP